MGIEYQNLMPIFNTRQRCQPILNGIILERHKKMTRKNKIIKTHNSNVKASVMAKLKNDGLDISHFRMINVKTGQVHNNRGHITWSIANNGKRIKGRFAKQ